MTRRSLSRRRKPALFPLASRQLRTARSRGPRTRRLVVERLESRWLLASIALGEYKRGTLSSPSEVDTYTFSAAANNVVTLTVAKTDASPYRPYADLYTPTGDLVRTVWSGSKEVCTLPETGTYTIQVYDSGHDAAGDYTIDLQGINPLSLDALSLICSETHSGSVALGEVDEYRLYGEINDVVTLAVGNTDAYPYRPYADLYTSTGNLVGTLWSGTAQQYTLPVTGPYVIQVYDSGHDAGGNYNFTLQWTSPLKGCIAGQKFNDLDADGIKESGEYGLQGWDVFLDANNNGEWNTGERKTVTDILGNYSLTSLAKGTYHVREVPQDGWQQTMPPTEFCSPMVPSAAYDVTLSSGQVLTGQDFGNTQKATISGLKWYDADGDGFVDGTEARLSGWEIYLDTNNNGVWNTGEPKTTTRSDGCYRFINLTPGTYRVREVPQTGWQQTWPTSGYYTVTLAAGQWFSEGYFGNRETPPSGFTVTPTSGLVTTEGGGTTAFTVKLNSQPTANVSVGLSSSDTTEGTVFPTGLTFTTANWSTPQTVTVTGVDDWVDDGDIAYTIVTAAAVSSDPNYNGLNPPNVSATNLDNDVAGFTVTCPSGMITTESGGTATCTIKLNTQPAANVIVPVSSSDTTEGTVSPGNLTFTASNWSTTQTVTVTGVDDSLVDGDITYTMIFGPATSGDPKYNGLDPPDCPITNVDDDVPGGPSQIVSDAAASYAASAGATVQFPVRYTTSDGDTTLTGLGLRMHFDSTKLAFNQFRNVLATGFLQKQEVPFDDTFDDFDNDPSTDKFVLVAWFDTSGQWPNQSLPTKLFDADFTLQAGLADGTTTQVNFSASSKDADYVFEGRSITVAVAACSLDVDGNCVADALTDGMLILRYLFGFTGTALVEGAVAPNATRTDPAAITEFLDGCRSTMLDVDANGMADALTDGILILRYLFGFRGPPLIEGALAPDATRRDPIEIAAFLDGFLPNCGQSLAGASPASFSVFAGETLQSTEDQQAESSSQLFTENSSTTASPSEANGDTSEFSDSVEVAAPVLAADVAEGEPATALLRTVLVAPMVAHEQGDELSPRTLPSLPLAVTELSRGYPDWTMFDCALVDSDSAGYGKRVWDGSDLSNLKSDLDVFTAVLSEMRLVPDVKDLEEKDEPMSGLLEFGLRHLPTIEDVDELLASGKWLE